MSKTDDNNPKYLRRKDVFAITVIECNRLVFPLVFSFMNNNNNMKYLAGKNLFVVTVIGCNRLVSPLYITM